MDLVVRLQNELVQFLTDIKTSTSYKILVIDKVTKPIVITLLTKDILDKLKITHIELIENSRSNLPLSAIYLLQTSLNNLNLLLKDSTNNFYSEFHLIFTSLLLEEHLDLLSGMDANKVQSLLEFPLNFHIDTFNNFYLLNDQMNQSGKGEGIGTLMVQIYSSLKLTPKFTSKDVLVQPKVYQSFQKGWIESQDLSEAELKTKLGDKEGVELLVLERSLDLIHPLLLDFSYQNIINHFKTNIENLTETDTHIEYKDELFIKFGLLPYSEAVKNLKLEFQSLMKPNLNAIHYLMGKDKEKGEKTDVDQLKKAVLDLPKVNKIKKHFDTQFNIINLVQPLVEKNRLNEIVVCQEQLLIGKGGEEETVDLMISIIYDTEIELQLRIQLLTTYILLYKPTPEDRLRLERLTSIENTSFSPHISKLAKSFWNGYQGVLPLNNSTPYQSDLSKLIKSTLVDTNKCIVLVCGGSTDSELQSIKDTDKDKVLLVGRDFQLDTSKWLESL